MGKLGELKCSGKSPVFQTSVGRWRRYEGRLGPLLEALGEYAPEAAGGV